MGCMLRSDKMSLCDVYLQPEAAFDIVSRFGEMGCLQFLDINPDAKPYQRHYVSEVCRCAEMERQLRYIEAEMRKDDIKIPDLDYEPVALQPNEMSQFENSLEKWENDILDMSENQTNLLNNYLELREMSYVLNQIGPLLGDAEITPESFLSKKGGGDPTTTRGRLVVISGVVHRNRCFPFEMMLWRVSRGNIYYRQAPEDAILLDPTTGKDIRKVAFLAICQGEQLSSRMDKVCTGFRVNIYPCPETKDERMDMIIKLNTRISDLEQVLKKTKYHRCKALRAVGKQLNTWMMQVRKSKAIYHTMNLFSLDITKNCLIGQCWVPDSDLVKVNETLEHCSESPDEHNENEKGFVLSNQYHVPTYQVFLNVEVVSDNQIDLSAEGHKTIIYLFDVRKKILSSFLDNLDKKDNLKSELNRYKYKKEIRDQKIKAKVGTNVPSFMSKTETLEIPPTYHRTNKFTNGFQTLINAYGDSTYRELNPGLYTIITFPFLFAIMFGDVGHGLILVLFSGWMVMKEDKYLGRPSGNEIWNIFFGGRYVILLMGIFSVIVGFLYNDLFSKHMYIMESYWKNTFTLEEIASQKYLTLDPAKETTTPYVLGVDPLWEFAVNKIMSQNSFKMKMSIIIGIIHMIFGLVLSLFNHIQFKHYHAIVLQFIPQMLFLCCIFLWLVVLIYMKWFLFNSKTANIKRSAGCAPLILIIFIDMALFSTSKPIEKDCDAYMFPGQHTLQTTLVVIALASVPILFFGTPFYVYKSNKKKKLEALKKISHFRRYQQRDSDRKSEELMLAEVAKYSVTLGEILIHQAIHSIEFVLSTVSHTASYLRLWALSLAHQQLSEMLWSMILSKLALRDRSLLCPVKIYLVFIVWAVFTVSILVVMEGLSAFLHTLRLHWVEFMSKFYEGGGYPFRPFNFKDLYGSDKDKGPEAVCKKRQKQ